MSYIQWSIMQDIIESYTKLPYDCRIFVNREKKQTGKDTTYNFNKHN